MDAIIILIKIKENKIRFIPVVRGELWAQQTVQCRGCSFGDRFVDEEKVEEKSPN